MTGRRFMSARAYTVADVMELTGLSRKGVLGLLEPKGDLRWKKPGKHILICAKDVDAMLDFGSDGDDLDLDPIAVDLVKATGG